MSTRDSARAQSVTKPRVPRTVPNTSVYHTALGCWYNYIQESSEFILCARLLVQNLNVVLSELPTTNLSRLHSLTTLAIPSTPHNNLLGIQAFALSLPVPVIVCL